MRADYSKVAISIVLYMRDMENKVLRPVAFFCRLLRLGELKYAPNEGEALAFVWGMQKARPFICGPLLLVSDHSDLQFMQKSINLRLVRWAIRMAEFDYLLVFAPGQTNFLQDFLTRSRLRDPKKDPPLVFKIEEVTVIESAEQTKLLARVEAIRLCDELDELPHQVVEGRIVLTSPPPPEVIDHMGSRTWRSPLWSLWGCEIA